MGVLLYLFEKEIVITLVLPSYSETNKACLRKGRAKSGNFTMVDLSCYYRDCRKWLHGFIYFEKEQDMDNEFIEKEGEVYMKRLEEERERRNQESDKDSVLL